MCGPSKAAKNLNNQVQDFNKQVTSEAGTIFGNSNTVFNNILNATQSIVQGGPSQAGFSQNELNAMNASNVENAGAMARNLKGAAASSGAAIGGGNSVAPAGSTQAAVTSAEQAAAALQAQGANNIVQQDFATGNQNFFKALSSEEAAPGVYSTSIEANKEAGDEQTAAQKSQQNIDTQSNWWKNDINQIATSAIGMGVGAFTGGLGGGLAKMALGGITGGQQMNPSAMPGNNGYTGPTAQG